MEKLVGKQLPNVKLVQDERRHQTEIKRQLVVGHGAEQRLHDENRGIGDQEKFDCGRHRAWTK